MKRGKPGGRKEEKNSVSAKGEFSALLDDVKNRIQASQTRAVLAVNAELTRLYWDIGRIIDGRQKQAGWGAAVIPRLAKELKNELPEVKGFSERNIKRMLAFYRDYPDPAKFVPQPGAQFNDSILWTVPWAHHVILMDKTRDRAIRAWYMEQTLASGWSRNILALQIEAGAHRRHGKAVSNFASELPSPQSDLAQQTLKDPYIFDFLTLTDPFHERELETELVRHLESFLIELGQGFAFVGRLNFYCNVVNDRLKHADDKPTIGLILCQERDRLLAEYSFSGIDKPIGISTYQLTRLHALLPSKHRVFLLAWADDGTGGASRLRHH